MPEVLPLYHHHATFARRCRLSRRLGPLYLQHRTNQRDDDSVVNDPKRTFGSGRAQHAGSRHWTVDGIQQAVRAVVPPVHFCYMYFTRDVSTRATGRTDMAAADKLGGYATGFGELNADTVAANVTDDFKLLDKDGKIYGKGDLSGYIAESESWRIRW